MPHPFVIGYSLSDRIEAAGRDLADEGSLFWVNGEGLGCGLHRPRLFGLDCTLKWAPH